MTMPVKQPRPRVITDSVLDSKSGSMLFAALAISIGISIPRFGPGIPMSVDTTSHLYRILFLQRWLKEGFFPFWSPDWYAGSPALLLYPPLSYYVAIAPGMLGMDPLLSYKIVDAIFYWIAPVTIYFLGKELGFTRGESALGALLFSLVPEVIENYLFFDRFPTVISIPIFCAFVIMFHRALTQPQRSFNLLASILTMSALILTHHLSALIAGMVAVLMVLLTVGKGGFKKPATVLMAVAVGTLALAAFWLVPFVLSLRLFATNPFFNRNVSFPFLRFAYFGFDVTSYLLGIVQFVLAAVAVHSIIGRTFAKGVPVNALLFFPILLGGMAFFQAGEVVHSDALGVIGQVFVVLSFIVFVGQFAVKGEFRSVVTRQNGVLLAVFWFVVFLWIGLGYFAIPILWVPYLREFWIKTMDVYRIWLYLALPMSILAARGFLLSLSKLWLWRRTGALVVIALTVLPIALGVALKVNYAFTAPVNNVLPYSTANAEIPASIVDYLRSDSSQGRILGINVPFWIYVLPSYVDKPIVDGWYPQSKLVTPLSNINDYRLDDLETTPPVERVETWKGIIQLAEPLSITWVIIGNRTLADMLMKDSNFKEQIAVPYEKVELIIFKAVKVPSFVEGDNGSLANVSRPNPDEIVLTFNPSTRGSIVVVKEAYFPTWAAMADNQDLKVQRDNDLGYIVLELPARTRQVTLHQRIDSGIWNMVSAISLVVFAGLCAVLVVGKKRR